MNVQIYFHDKCETLQSISQEKKRLIFNSGLSVVVSSVKELKILIIETGFFGVTSIDGNMITKNDGLTEDVTFEINVDETYQPASKQDIYCLFSTVDHLFFNESMVNVHYVVKVSKIQKEREKASGNGALNDDVKRKIKRLIDLFGRGADKLGEIVSDDDLEAVSFLENLSR